jgi:hypothetical protein
VIHIVIRAGVVSVAVALAASVHASPITSPAARHLEAVHAEAAAPCPAESAPTWISDALLGAFVRHAGAATRAAAPAVATDEQPLVAKPNQNPAFPAAFVFQSHSASFLAVDVTRRPAHTEPPVD